MQNFLPFRFSLLLAFGPSSLGIVTPAIAMEGGQCFLLARMNSNLSADGQRTIIIGDREVLINPTGKVLDASVQKNMEAVTSNLDGTLGYQLSGDRPKSQISVLVCVAAKLTNIRLFNNKLNGIPKAAFLGGSFDDSLRSNERLGTTPMLMADTVHKIEDGTDHIGLPMQLLGNPAIKSGFIITRMPDGKMQGIAQMADTNYTAEGQRRLTALNKPPEPKR